MFGEVFAVVGEPGELALLDIFQGVGEGHFAPTMLVAIGFAVRSDVDELIPVAGVGKSAGDPVRKLLAGIQKFLEGYGLRNRGKGPTK